MAINSTLDFTLEGLCVGKTTWEMRKLVTRTTLRLVFRLNFISAFIFDLRNQSVECLFRFRHLKFESQQKNRDRFSWPTHILLLFWSFNTKFMLKTVFFTLSTILSCRMSHEIIISVTKQQNLSEI